MVRSFFRKNIKTLNHKNIVFSYKKFLAIFYRSYVKQEILYNSNVNVTLPQRQQYFNFQNIRTLKSFNFSVGRYLITMGQTAKYFKRSPKNVLTIILQLKKNFSNLLKLIFLLSLKNFNHRQFIFFKKFMAIIKPEIKYFIHKHSYIPRFLPKRRIRRKILRLLNKR